MNKASLKMLIRYWNYLQDLSTLYLQSAFFIENWQSAILHNRRNEVTYGYVCEGRSPSLKTVRALSKSF